MTQKALIINPWICDFKLYDEWMHPLGLYFLISLLKHNNWEIEYINCLERTEKSKPKRYGTGTFPYEELTRPSVYTPVHRKYKRYGISRDLFLDKLNRAEVPDVIFIGSGMTYWIDGLVATVQQARKLYRDIPIVIGGIAAALIPDRITAHLPDTFLYRGSLFEDISTLAQIHPILKTITTAGWHPTLIDAFILMEKHYHGPILTSLGCPLHCSYCASSHLQHRFFQRPLTVILDEIHYLTESAGVIDFSFYDDALFYKPQKGFIPLANLLYQENMNVRLHAPNGLHIRWLDQQVLDAMKRSGFITIRFGYESSQIRYAKETSAKTNRKEVQEKIANITAAGFNRHNIGIYVMAGLPGQTVEDVFDEMAFVASCNVRVLPVFLSPVPYTELFTYYEKLFPRITHDPLFHNDTFFITQLPGWNYAIMEEVKAQAREMNKGI